LDGVDYSTTDVTNFVPDLALIHGGIAMIAVQRKPDTRIHAVFNDGTVGLMVYDLNEEEHAWVMVETAGLVEDVVVLPGTYEDRVYYTVKRVINGSTVRYLERWAREDECTGRPMNKQADAFSYYTGAAVTTIAGLDHLEGATVVCWGWNTSSPFTDSDGNTIGLDFGTFTVSGGQITGLSKAVTDCVVGLGYTAQFQSTKLAYAAKLGTALNQRKRVVRVGFVLVNAHAQGLKYGPDFSTLDDMPMIDGGLTIDQNTVWPEYDSDTKPFAAKWGTDARLCLQASAPRPVTLLGAIIDVDTRERG
jgi:hypothetical protein